MLLGSAVFGSRWFDNADPFEVYFSLVSRLSPWGRLSRAHDGAAGRLVIRNPLDNLDGTVVRPGLVVVLAVLLGSTAFDSFSVSNYWLATTAQSGGLNPQLRDTLVLGGFVLFVGATFSVGAVTAPGLTRKQRVAMPGILAHCLVPIVVGYIFAHYLTLLLEYGQQTLVQLSDPLLTGADYLVLSRGHGDRLAVPGISQDALDPARRANAETRFELLHTVLGKIIGETLGYALTATFTVLVVVALSRTSMPRWLALTGYGAAALIATGIVIPVAAAASLANFAGYVIWCVWLLAVAALLFTSPSRTLGEPGVR